MTSLISEAGIVLGATASSSEEAVALCGEKLLELGAISQEYADAMWEREQIFPSAIGANFAIPHGTDDSRKFVKFDQLVFFQLANPIDWAGEEVKCVLGIASKGDGHVEILGGIATLLQEPDALKVFTESSDKVEILKLINSAASE